jgi:pimeloyl-ACP methyl ester carboxylesterase
MPTTEGAGVLLSYAERNPGATATVLLIHDIASDAAALAATADAIARGGARVIAYDRRGYGHSEAPEPYGGTTVAEQSRDAVALLRGLDAAPAVVAGDGWGGLVALELAVQEPGLVRAVVARDAPALAFVAEATEELSQQRAMLEQALAAGGPAAAVRAWLGDRGDADPGRRERATQAHRAFFADYAGLASWAVTRAQLRAVAVGVTLVCGPDTPPAVAAAAEALLRCCPTAVRRDDGDLAAAVIAAA